MPTVDDAACAHVDPEVWFPESTWGGRQAKQICRGCDLRDACLQYALDHHIDDGIWGGMSPRERAQLQRERKIAS